MKNPYGITVLECGTAGSVIEAFDGMSFQSTLEAKRWIRNQGSPDTLYQVVRYCTPPLTVRVINRRKVEEV